ncbi:MAG: putative membrane protein [Litorivivens sp.]|jgi:uncharacterized membrane protein
MKDRGYRISQLVERIEWLAEKQEDFSREINDLRLEIDKLKNIDSEGVELVLDRDEVNAEVIPIETLVEQPKIESPLLRPKRVNSAPKSRLDLEKFIGENLLNKIGIVITVIGVAIGAKYSIEHDLVSPLTRIVLGYLLGIGLLGVGAKLKKNYEGYSAVLVSGAIAIMYFITYSAYSFYELIPQLMAFALMVVLTIFTVIAAIKYNRQLIAHIGMVGAYAVPLLLSEGSGNVAFLLTYVAIINVGILAIAFSKYWRPLYFASFVLTWLVFFSWYFIGDYQIDDHFYLALTFVTVYFGLFYATFLAYKLIRKDKIVVTDILMLLANSFIFYWLGVSILSYHEVGRELLGLFTVGNATVHFVISVVIYKRKMGDTKLFYLVSGLVLVFITMAIPVQLDGNWVTLLWSAEAALLFWIGRSKGVVVYEKLSYVLMLLAFMSINQDWANEYGHYYQGSPETWITPILNINFLNSLLFIAAFGFIYYLSQLEKYPSPFNPKGSMSKVISYSLGAILLFALYYACRIEIFNYLGQLYIDSGISISEEGQWEGDRFQDYDLLSYRNVWLANYTLLFTSILAFVNMAKLKNSALGFVNLVLSTLAIFWWLSLGLYEISELRESYLQQLNANIFHRGTFNIAIRYISLLFLALTLFSSYQYLLREFKSRALRLVFDLVLHVSILWFVSSELLHWMDFADTADSYKLGLSILWGVYSLLVITLGIWKKKMHLRIGAMALFGVTLIKLFFYDISHLDTISKTVVFVSLGILLLIISFLYNKFKNSISDETRS